MPECMEDFPVNWYTVFSSSACKLKYPHAYVRQAAYVMSFEAEVNMKRHDGRLLRSIGPFEKLYPYIIHRRSEAQVFAKQQICTAPIDLYIQEKRMQNVKINYLHVFVAVFLRVIAQRPNLNRFVMNSKLYARNGIHFSMVVKRSLSDTGAETTVKYAFTGHETIFEVIDIISKVIDDARENPDETDSDKLVAKIMSAPGFFKKTLVGMFKWMDRHNMLPKSVLDTSPFHATLFLTYLKSIKTDYVYHHQYNLGTAGTFAAIGQTEMMPVVEDGVVVARKCCEIGYAFDDRICDGLYLANSLKLAQKYLSDLTLLEKPLEEVVQDVP